MTAHRRYTKAEKAHAIGVAAMSTVEAASESLGIPESTMRYWWNSEEFVQLRAKTRDEVADEMWAAIQMGVREVGKGLVGDAPLRDKATALGILYDKHALLTGSATSRTESRDISGSLTDIDLVEAVREAERVTSEGGVAPPSEDPPAG